jgi:CheY-like chemotaxis protein
VLLLDDVPELRAALRHALELRASFVVAGESGDPRTAVALAREHQPDLIVIDLGLSDLAGRGVLTRLRAAAPDAFVLVHSGSHVPDRAAISRSIDALVDKSQDKSRDKLPDIDYVVDLLDEIGSRIPKQATMRFGPDIHDIALARRFVADCCAEWDRSPICDDAAIVVSELVANALVHTRSACEMTVGLRDDVLRVEVVDHGGGMPDLRDGAVGDERGRGLVLVSILCSAWGSEPRDDGKSVWAELRAEPSPEDGRRSGVSGAGRSLFFGDGPRVHVACTVG